ADELLSSWLTRLSLAHGLTLHAFGTNLWPAPGFWERDIDRCATPAFLTVLGWKTATSPQCAFATTLTAYEGTLSEGCTPPAHPLWLLATRRQRQRCRLPGLQYCPQCLQADAIPYFRRCWRLGFVTVCTTHRRRLLDRCAACGEPVHLHRLPGETETLTRC